VLCADDAVVGVAPEHRAIAEETLEVLRGAMRGELFSRAHAATRARIASRRDARRRAKALDAVVDPERAARARIAKAAKRTAARKRKVQERRAGKGSSGSAKKRAREL
jgi:U3 small nucleolar RNA-associated protein 20